MADERLTLRQAAARLGVSESAIRKRVERGTLRSDKGVDGRRYVYLDTVADTGVDIGADVSATHERDALTSELRAHNETLQEQLRLEREAHAEARRLLAAALERIPAIEPPPEGGSEPVPETPAPPEPETPRVVDSSVSRSRLGMSARAVAVGAIATLLTWFFVLEGTFAFYSNLYDLNLSIPSIFDYGTTSGLVLPMLVPLLSGLWAGSTKRPSLPWFSSPHRWLRRGGRSVLKIATFTIGVPVGVVLCGGLLPRFPINAKILPSIPVNPQNKVILMLLVFTLPLIAFMSGAFLGNALRRVGFLGTPKEPLQGEEEVEQEEVWSPRKEAQWGLAGSIIVALASVLAAAIK